MDYFTRKATQALTSVDAPNADPGCIAAWAKIAHDTGNRDGGIIIDADGVIHAETGIKRDILLGSVKFIKHADTLGLQVSVLDLGMPALSRMVGKPLAHLTYHQLATGAGKKVA